MGKKELETLLEYLKDRVAYIKKSGDSMEEASFGYEEGILITGNDALMIMEAISAVLEDNK